MEYGFALGQGWSSTMIVFYMSIRRSLYSIIGCVCVILLLLTACNRKKQEAPDRPRLTPNVAMQDITFRSAALNRYMHYRVVLPATIAAGTKLPVVYLLHGRAGNFRDWSTTLTWQDLPREV